MGEDNFKKVSGFTSFYPYFFSGAKTKYRIVDSLRKTRLSERIVRIENE